MLFKPMKKEDIHKALQGHHDVLKPAYELSERLFKSISCPSCGGEVMAIVNSSNPFKEGSVVPNFLAKCRKCEVEFEPYTRIQVTMPKSGPL